MRMPNCPNCGSNKHVELSDYPEKGSHYCSCLPIGEGGWFTPKATNEISQEVARGLLAALKLAIREMTAAVAKAEGTDQKRKAALLTPPEPMDASPTLLSGTTTPNLPDSENQRNSPEAE